VVGDGALVVAVGDVDALAEGLVSVATDDTVRARLAIAGPVRAAHYSWDECASGLVAVYRQALLGS
jgi:alpha-1,3-rhamnosyl/mannosyltransferase